MTINKVIMEKSRMILKISKTGLMLKLLYHQKKKQLRRLKKKKRQARRKRKARRKKRAKRKNLRKTMMMASQLLLRYIFRKQFKNLMYSMMTIMKIGSIEMKLKIINKNMMFKWPNLKLCLS